MMAGGDGVRACLFGVECLRYSPREESQRIKAEEVAERAAAEEQVRRAETARRAAEKLKQLDEGYPPASAGFSRSRMYE